MYLHVTYVASIGKRHSEPSLRPTQMQSQRTQARSSPQQLRLQEP